jgi:hypothetical protein
MSNFLFSVLYVAKLTINNAFSLFKTTIELGRAIEPQLTPVLIAALNQLAIDNEKFGKEINKMQKSGLTDDLKLLDKERDSLYAEIKRVLNSYLKSSEANKQAAAKLLQLFLTPYLDAAVLPLNTETDILVEILNKYKAAPDLQTAAKTLDIVGLFTALKEKNTAFYTAYHDRLTENSGRGKTSGSLLKPAVVASYIQFSSAVEQAANLTPNPEIIVLFNKMDDLRKKYHLLDGSGKDTPSAPETPAK